MQGREVSLLIHLFQYAVHRKRLGCNPSLVVQYESDLLQSGGHCAIGRLCLRVSPEAVGRKLVHLLGVSATDCVLQPTLRRFRIQVNERSPPEAAAFSACRLEEKGRIRKVGLEQSPAAYEAGLPWPTSREALSSCEKKGESH